MALERIPQDPMRGSDDVELLRRLADRRPDALSELYDRYSPLLLAVTRRILGSSADAEAILHESFVQAWNQAGRYDSGRSSVSTWLVLIARACALDRLRQPLPSERAAAAGEEMPPAPEGSARLAEHMPIQERRRRVRTALAGLPVDQKQVMELAFFEGLSQAEIAERTRTPLATVKTRALLALKKLRRDLRDEIRELM